MNSVHLLATFWPPFGFGEKSPDKMQTASGHRLAGVGRQRQRGDAIIGSSDGEEVGIGGSHVEIGSTVGAKEGPSKHSKGRLFD